VRAALGTLVLGLALCLAGAAVDTPSLYVPGLALVALAFGCTLWVALAAHGARVERAPGPAHVVEEEPYPVRVEVRTGLLPPPGGELDEPLLGWPVPIAGRWQRRIRINVRFSRRGPHVLEPGRLVIRDPLRLAVREVVGEGREEVLVLPRTEPVAAAGPGAGAGDRALRGEGAAGRRLERATAELEVDGLRPYREGAPASRIHWPTVARTGEIVERRLVADLDSSPLVVLDASFPAGEEALDEAVRAAASLCLHLARDSGCSILLPGERRPADVGTDLHAWPHVHARLAFVEPTRAAPVVSGIARSGAVFWVSAAAMRRAPGALDRIPAAARFLVTPTPLSGRRPAFTVAGCTGQRLDRSQRHAGSRAA
jgi:uncharacterized protein (DUF58 family)